MTLGLLGLLIAMQATNVERLAFWGLVDLCNAGRMSEGPRLFQELVISALAAVALYIAGQPALGRALALISILHHGLV